MGRGAWGGEDTYCTNRGGRLERGGVKLEFLDSWGGLGYSDSSAKMGKASGAGLSNSSTWSRLGTRHRKEHKNNGACKGNVVWW